MKSARKPIERRSLPSREEWQRTYAKAPGVPVIFTGAIEHWPARRDWSFDWLVKKHPELRIPVRVFDGNEFSMIETTLAEFVSDSAPIGYLANIDLGRAIPHLDDDCDFPFVHRRLSQCHYWIGPRGTLSALHRDFSLNLFAQIRGRKRFLLFAPDRSPELEATGTTWYSSFSALDLNGRESTDHLPEPDYDFEIEAGELLFLPYAWWHRVWSLEPSMSVNTFWLTPGLALRRGPLALGQGALNRVRHLAKSMHGRLMG